MLTFSHTFAEIQYYPYNEAAKEVEKNEKSNRNRSFGGVSCFNVWLCKYRETDHRRTYRERIIGDE